MRHARRSRRVLASLLTVALATTGLGLTATSATAAVDPPAYYPSGPQQDVPVSTLTDGGWTECYSDVFATPRGPGAEDILDDCDSRYIILAGRRSGSDTLLLLAAAPLADAIADTGAYTATTTRSNGSEWYFSRNGAWGYAPGGETVTLAPCDTSSGAKRLCVHTVSGEGGYRVGDVTELNDRTDYEVVAYEAGGPVLAAQTVTFTSTRPEPASIGSSYTVEADGGGSDQPVTFSLTDESDDVCSIDGAEITFDHAGECTVQADQAGDDAYDAAPSVQQQITVAQTAQTVAFESDVPLARDSVVGATYEPETSGGDSGAPVVLATESAACTLADGVVTFDHPGLCVVTADQAGTDDYSAASTQSQEIVIGQAATTTDLTVTKNKLVADVSVTAPGAGDPSGDVTFLVGGTSVGTAPVEGGVATLAYSVPSGRARAVAVSYAGSTDFAGSADSLTRNDPKITATVTSSAPKSRFGWYRTPVTVRFTCTPRGAVLATPCPRPVTVTRQGVAKAITRTVAAKDGGIASVTVSRVAIDRSKPRVAVAGVKDGAGYAGQAPAARCSARDGVSGIASCTLTRTVKGSRTTVTARATDRAGNVARTSVSYSVRSVYIEGASHANGVYTVEAGRTYTLVVNGSTTRPVYYDAEVAPRQPSTRDHGFVKAGSKRWTLSVTMQHGMEHQRLWNLGVKTGSTMKVLQVRAR